MIRRQLPTAFRMILVLTVLTGIAYPLTVTVAAQGFFRDKADGSMLERNGRPVGSRLIGQAFTRPEYFHPRPSAAGDGYEGAASGGSNLGPSNPKLIAAVEQRARIYRTQNGLPADAPVPVDAVTSSASGLDPHISVANARIQAGRVARERKLPSAAVLALVRAHTDPRGLGFLGEPGVNVLELNLVLGPLDHP